MSSCAHHRALLWVLASALVESSPLPPIQLRTNWGSPLGPHEVLTVPTTGLRLSWQLQQPTQTAYEVEIWADSLIWSTMLNSSTQELVASPYPELRAGATFTWRARISDGSGFSEWSRVSSFDTAPSPASWGYNRAAWIGGPNMSTLQTERNLPANAKISRARAYVTAAGAFTLQINGQRVGNNICDPGQTVYDRRLLYNTFNIAPF